MALRELTSPGAVRQAINEFDQLGRANFLAKYGFGEARSYFVLHEGRRYDSKPILGAAHGYEFPGTPLRPEDFSGGEATVAKKLEELGFEVERPQKEQEQATLPELTPGTVYTWEELGAAFEFAPGYLGSVGGMVSRPKLNALLIITHPGGAKSIDYGDKWDGPDLIYTGRGTVGDQEYAGQNRMLGENTCTNYVFEPGGTRRLKFIGVANCVDHWEDRQPDKKGDDRKVFRYRLQFSPGATPVSGGSGQQETRPPEAKRANVLRTARAFRPDAPPASPVAGAVVRSREETLALQEKALKGHHALLCVLHSALQAASWTEIEELPGAIDLQGRPPGGGTKVIFEAKTVTPQTEVDRTREALAQLREYRYFHGYSTDRLCLVTDSPVSEERVRFLESEGIAVIWWDGERFQGPGAKLIPELAALLAP